MAVQRTSDTSAEIRLRRALHRAGLRYRVHVPVPGAPRRTMDIAFTRQRVAVHVDGCFWHGCEEHFVRPGTNSSWWLAKIDSNRARDAETDDLLRVAGWTVLRVWEHEPTESAVERTVRVVRG
ncbi:very short patch repair endonuclease [Yimella lutea]|uniref:very short patch repair endonuclease n=1 Tax=Yimella lutea TaxID=587872 RepID=UPI00115141A8|nr:very short patch repair endonuclease [Yimella lutea]